MRFGDYLELISGRDLKSTDYQDNLAGEVPYLTEASNFKDGTVLPLEQQIIQA